MPGFAFLEHPLLLVLVAIASLPIYLNLAKIFFGDDYEELAEALKYALWPDIYSLFKGKFWADWDATLKLNVFIALCLGWAAAVTEALARFVMH